MPLTCLLSFAGAFAQSAADVRRHDDLEWFRHIRIADPGRPDRPLRQENINDEEVREIQQAALGVYPDFIVNISGVTNGCDCEEGSACTAQVWIALYRGEQIRGLVLSKLDGHWKMGVVQRWWLEYSAHQSTNPGSGESLKHIAWLQKNQGLLDRFPACSLAPANWTLVRTGHGFSEYVDMSSMQVSGPIRRVNFKRVFPPQPKKYDWPSRVFNISSKAFDCKARRTRLDWLDSYDDDGRAYKNRGSMDSVLWDPVRPNTDSAVDWDRVCESNEKAR